MADEKERRVLEAAKAYVNHYDRKPDAGYVPELYAERISAVRDWQRPSFEVVHDPHPRGVETHLPYAVGPVRGQYVCRCHDRIDAEHLRDLLNAQAEKEQP